MSDYIDGDYQDIEPGSQDDPFEEAPRLGTLLRHYRKRAGLSQRQLAGESQVEQSNISLIERGDTKTPWNATLETLGETLARHIPGISGRVIADRLIEAKNMKPTEYYGVDPQAVMLSDRMATHDARTKRVIYEAISHMMDAFEELQKGG